MGKRAREQTRPSRSTGALTLREAILSRLKNFEPEYQQLLRHEQSTQQTAQR